MTLSSRPWILSTGLLCDWSGLAVCLYAFVDHVIGVQTLVCHARTGGARLYTKGIAHLELADLLVDRS